MNRQRKLNALRYLILLKCKHYSDLTFLVRLFELWVPESMVPSGIEPGNVIRIKSVVSSIL